MKNKGPYAAEKAHVGTKNGEIGYTSNRNVLVWNEKISVKTLNIAEYDKNVKISIFQKMVFREKGTSVYWKKLRGLQPP